MKKIVHDSQVFGDNSHEKICLEWDPSTGAWRQSFQPPYTLAWTDQAFNDVGAKILRERYGIAVMPTEQIERTSPLRLDVLASEGLHTRT